MTKERIDFEIFLREREQKILMTKNGSEKKIRNKYQK